MPARSFRLTWSDDPRKQERCSWYRRSRKKGSPLSVRGIRKGSSTMPERIISASRVIGSGTPWPRSFFNADADLTTIRRYVFLLLLFAAGKRHSIIADAIILDKAAGQLRLQCRCDSLGQVLRGRRGRDPEHHSRCPDLRDAELPHTEGRSRGPCDVHHLRSCSF